MYMADAKLETLGNQWSGQY